MTTDISNENRSLSINTPLQKKNDDTIQNLFLNNYKYYKENPGFKKITGKNYDLIISHKSTIPDLVIYNKVFNKNECFLEANRKENNYFPRKQFYIKFIGNEKKKYINSIEYKKYEEKGIEMNENSEHVDDDDDDENEEEEDDEERDITFDNLEDNTNNINKLNYELRNGMDNSNKNNENSYLENNSIISNNNSMIKDYELFQKNYHSINNGKSMIKPESLNQSRMNFFENSFNFEETKSVSFDSNIVNNINNLVEIKSDDVFSILSNRCGINGNMNMKNFNSNNFNNDILASPSVQNILNNFKNKNLNMFVDQMILLKKINQIKNYQKAFNQNCENQLKEINENIIQMALFSKEGNIVGNSSNCFEIFEYITKNILERNKRLIDYKIYRIDTEEFIEGDSFYFPIIIFLSKISQI